ncbi:hypothetical protein [Sorangium sp. So ce204]|uniref:hypothetical protein n=1 Tax=Sorangium sp. So ce204 TaxID=3133288 RepID=UPI003F6258AF
MPASLERIDLVVEIAGRRFEERFACPREPNSETTFSWDGKDASGRPLEGAQPITVRVRYVYLRPRPPHPRRNPGGAPGAGRGSSGGAGQCGAIF